MAEAKRDNNQVTTLLAVSNADGITPVVLWADPSTHRLLVSYAVVSLSEISNVTITSLAQGDVFYYNGTAWVNLAPGTNGQVLTTAGAAANPSWTTISGTGDILADGTIPLTANWDVGSFTITGTQFVSDIVTGTAPFVVASTTVVTNLNADLLDGAQGALYARLASPTFSTSVTGSYLTASEMLITDGSKGIISAPVATYPSLAELIHVKGVTSAIQTQLGTKAPLASPTFTGTVTMPVGLTGVLRADTGVVGVDTDITDLVSASSLTVAGKIEIATTAEIDTGTDSTRAMPVDQFVASKRNIRWLVFNVVDRLTDCAVLANVGGDFVSPIAGTILQSDTTPFYCYATNSIAGTTGTMVVDVHLNGTTIMTTNKLDFDTTEKTTTTGATVTDLTTTSLAVGDIITIDVDAVHTTAAKGLTVYLAIRE